MSTPPPFPPPSLLFEEPLQFSSDDEFDDDTVLTLGTAAAEPRPDWQEHLHEHPQQLQDQPTPPPQHSHASHQNPRRHHLSISFAAKMTLQLTRRSRRARLALLDRTLRDRIDDFEIAAIVCAHLHDRHATDTQQFLLDGAPLVAARACWKLRVRV